MSGLIRLSYRSSWDDDELAVDMRFSNLGFDPSLGTVESGGWRRNFPLVLADKLGWGQASQ